MQPSPISGTTCARAAYGAREDPSVMPDEQETSLPESKILRTFFVFPAAH